MFVSTVTLFSLIASAFATVYVTSPVASTTCNAGTACSLQWQDSNTTPSLAQFGLSSVGIYAGNQQQQTLLQEIVASVDVATTSTIQFTPDATIGPSGDFYFIRFTSLNLTDNSTSFDYPEEAFSSIFNLQGMTGTFNSTVQAEVNGASTAPIGGPTGTPATSTPASSPSGFLTSAAPTASTTVNSTTSSNSTSGADRMFMPGSISLAGLAVAALTFAL